MQPGRQQHQQSRRQQTWHMGWEPALLASGSGWQSPLLADTLNDPYSAVRYMAHKALAKQPGFVAFKYDFVAAEAKRLDKQKEAMSIWEREPRITLPQPASPVLLNVQGGRDIDRTKDLIRTRDNRPMRLRE